MTETVKLRAVGAGEARWACYEYATTHGGQAVYWTDHEGGRWLDSEPSAPQPPKGAGWELICMTASSSRLYWAWRRLKVSGPKKTKRKP